LNCEKPKSESKNIKLSYQIDERLPEHITADSVRLNQILMNLVSNPVKFTESGEVAISVECLEEDDERIVLDFSIKDTGIGMSLDKHEGIFESF
jgi:signal transduction histidine kinase